jgi:predicted anti-sigma-YlaC factor YlaD
MKFCNSNLLSLYLDEELPLSQRVEVERHLTRCTLCRDELESMQRVDSLVQRWSKSRVPLPPETNARILKTVNSHRRLGWVLTFSRVMPAAVGSSIAALLVVASASQGWLYRNAAPQASPRPSAAVATIIKKQSAPLYEARATSAMFGVRSNSQGDQSPRQHVVSEVE